MSKKMIQKEKEVDIRDAKLFTKIFGEQKFTDKQLEVVERIIRHCNTVMKMMEIEHEKSKKIAHEAGEEEGFNNGYEAGFEDGKDKGFKEGYKMATDNTGWKTTEGASENPHNNFTRKKDGKESKGIW